MVLERPNTNAFSCVQKGVVALGTIEACDVRMAVGELLGQSAHILHEDYLEAMRTARVQVHTPTGKEVIELLLEYAAYAESETVPICQDTGTAILCVCRCSPLVLATKVFGSLFKVLHLVRRDRLNLQQSVIPVEWTLLGADPPGVASSNWLNTVPIEGLCLLHLTFDNPLGSLSPFAGCGCGHRSCGPNSWHLPKREQMNR